MDGADGEKRGLAENVKFLGVVASFNEMKKSGMVASPEVQEMWGQECYAFQDVLASCGAAIGDTLRFSIHVNPRGQPQVSLPVFKVDGVGNALDVPEGTTWVSAEEMALQDPGFLIKLKQEIMERSARQNLKRGQNPKGSGKGKDKGKMMAMGMMGMGGGGYGAGYSPSAAQAFAGNGDLSNKRKHGWDEGPMGGMGVVVPGCWGKGAGAWGGGGDGWGGGGPAAGEVTLFVGGVPPGVTRRELLHIFRPYAGFSNLRNADREGNTLVFVTYATMVQAMFVMETLAGYVFDEELPLDQQTALSLSPAKAQTRLA